MRKPIQMTLLIAFLMLASFIAGRTWSAPEPGNLSIEWGSLPRGLVGKKADWNERDVPIGSLVDRLAGAYEVPIEVDWAALGAIGIGRDAKVSLVAHQVELIDAFGSIRADSVRIEEIEPLGRGGALLLTSAKEVEPFRAPRMYDIRELCRRMYGVDITSDPRPPPPPRPPSTSQNAYVGYGWPSFTWPEREVVLGDLLAQLKRGNRLGTHFAMLTTDPFATEIGGYMEISTTHFRHMQLRRRLNAMAAHPEEAKVWHAPATNPTGTP